MKNFFLKLFYLICITIFLFSCIPPSKDMIETNILVWLNELLIKFNKITFCVPGPYRQSLQSSVNDIAHYF